MQDKKKMGSACRSTLVLSIAGAGISGCAVERRPVPPTSAAAIFDTCVKPQYPRDALRRESVGTVTMMFYVEPDGRVSDSKIVKSAGDASLDNASLRYMKTCRFRPATENGKPVAQWTSSMQYVWSLQPSVGFPAWQ